MSAFEGLAYIKPAPQHLQNVIGFNTFMTFKVTSIYNIEMHSRCPQARISADILTSIGTRMSAAHAGWCWHVRAPPQRGEGETGGDGHRNFSYTMFFPRHTTDRTWCSILAGIYGRSSAYRWRTKSAVMGGHKKEKLKEGERLPVRLELWKSPKCSISDLYCYFHRPQFWEFGLYIQWPRCVALSWQEQHSTRITYDGCVD